MQKETATPTIRPLPEKAALQAEIATLERVLVIAKRLANAKDPTGALLVIARHDALERQFVLHYPSIHTSAKLDADGMSTLVERLATIDGAVLLSPEGDLIAYGARILAQETLAGFGTRHSAARGITRRSPGILAVLVSGESKWIKLFQGGEIIIEIDPSGARPGTMGRIARHVLGDTALITSGAEHGMSDAGSSGPVSIEVGGAFVLLPRGAAPPRIVAGGAA